MSLDRRLHEESDEFEAAALFMAGEPGCAERTLVAHRREENSSTCAGCRRAPEHPCFLAKVAIRALELLAAESTSPAVAATSLERQRALRWRADRSDSGR